MHIDFIFDQVFPSLTGVYHLAKKKIPYFDSASSTQVVPTDNNGYKLEMYIFDVFPLATSCLVMDVAREEEFAPVKNSPDSLVYSPTTAKVLLSAQNRHWVEACGGEVQGDGILEILRGYGRGKIFIIFFFFLFFFILIKGIRKTGLSMI